MVIRLKYFNVSLNIILILGPGREFLCVKCDQFALTFTE